MGDKKMTNDKKKIEDPIVDERRETIGVSSKARAYIDVFCILIAMIAVEILLGIMVLKQSVGLLLLIMGLNLLLALISGRLNSYFLFAIIAIQLTAGGLSSHTIIAIEGVALFATLCFAIKRFLR